MTQEILERIKASNSFKSLSPQEQETFLKTLENADEAVLKQAAEEIEDYDYLASLNEEQLVEEVKKREQELKISDSKLNRASIAMSEEIDREGEKSILNDIEDQLNKA